MLNVLMQFHIINIIYYIMLRIPRTKECTIGWYTMLSIIVMEPHETFISRMMR
jgi:hypothetical protein